jgi:2-dehydro-3-deoxygluconokinase
MGKILTIGEVMAVVYPDSPVSLSERPGLRLDFGGAEANFAIAASRLGHQVRYLSRLGADPFGVVIKNSLEQESVEVVAEIDEVLPTGLFFREWLSDASRRVYYYRSGSAASALSSRNIEEGLFEGVSLLHIGGITPALSESCHRAVERAIAIAIERNITISFDPNYRAKLWTNRDVRGVLEPLMKASNIILIGDDDARGIYGEFDREKLIEIFAADHLHSLVFKEGSAGSSLWSSETGVIHCPPFILGEAIDPVGAGDGFAAGYLTAFLEGLSKQEALRRGNYVGARSACSLGDYHGYPRREEIVQLPV